ncbi:MAG TPA: VOC family protein [Steroidobacteraceae bacterium]|nr:VOC family protein [Steroidobacteraceae bacterium]
MTQHLRIARPVTDVEHSARMYCHGLMLRILGSFRDHDGFDGIMVGSLESEYHLELTRSRRHPINPRPTPEDLLVFYHPSEPDWHLACERMTAAGFQEVPSFNPYWNASGRTYMDPDGYRVVLQQDAWVATPDPQGNTPDHE